MWWELRTPSPLFDLRLFRDRTFAASASAVMTVDTAMMGTMFMSVIFMIAMMDYSELKAGLAIATLPLAVMILTPPAGWLADRIGPRWLAVAGALLTAAGLIALGHLARTAPVSAVVWRSALVGAGIGLSLPALLAAGMSVVPGGHKGAGSGMLNTARQLGFLLGVAIIVAVFAHTMGQAVNRAADGAQALTRAQDGISQPIKDRLVTEFDKVRTIDATSGMEEIRRVAHPIAEDIGEDVGFFEGSGPARPQGPPREHALGRGGRRLPLAVLHGRDLRGAGRPGGRLPAAAPRRAARRSACGPVARARASPRPPRVYWAACPPRNSSTGSRNASGPTSPTSATTCSSWPTSATATRRSPCPTRTASWSPSPTRVRPPRATPSPPPASATRCPAPTSPRPTRRSPRAGPSSARAAAFPAA